MEQSPEAVRAEEGAAQAKPEEGAQLLKVKTADEIDMEKYHENENTENPYFRKYGVKKRSYFSQARSRVFESDEDSGCAGGDRPTSNHEVDEPSAVPRASCDLGSNCA